MHFTVLLALLALAIYGPQWWVRYTLQRYHQPDERFPGTGGEFARHLLKRYQIEDVAVEIAEGVGDHYDPTARRVCLTKDKFEGRSLTSVVVAAHEVGHAIQHATGYAPLLWRQRLAHVSIFSEKLGSFLLFAAPTIGLITRAPSIGVITLVAAALSLGVGLLVQLVTLPVEWNASFARALPLLESGYLERDQVPGAKRLLRACALSYIAASLVGLLNFWRWIRLLRR